MAVQELLDDVHVDTVAYVEEGLIVDNLLPAVDGHVLIYHVEAQVKMFRQALHSVDHALLVEEGAAALASQARGAELDADDLTFRRWGTAG